MKTEINIGKSSDGTPLNLDVETLIRTRLLVQANSGGGKSYLLRRIAEQLFGTVPVIIIDPEGEFATLREKFGYVLVGKGGETPADCRSAKLVAHKLLELRASAVIDLYEMNSSERHRYVKLFAEATIDAPKNLWRPTVFIFDEAHVFCPEKGAGESEASDAVVSFPTRGRKRRFCSIFATQRLGKLRKDASAELLNRLIGPTFEDVDLKRAADLLSITSENRREFDQQMRVCEPGNFFALGRALCKERTMVKVGPVKTSHEIEDAEYGSEPPPAPEQIRSLLPKLADLPKQAEEKAQTEQDLRRELTEQKRVNVQLQTQIGKVKTEQAVKEVPVLTEKELAQIQGVRELVEGLDKTIRKSVSEFVSCKDTLVNVMNGITKKTLLALPSRAGASRDTRTAPPVSPIKRLAPPSSVGDFTLSKKQQQIIDALAWLESIGQSPAKNIQVGAIALIDSTGGHFSNVVGPLSSNGLVDRRDGEMSITDAGRAMAKPLPNLTSIDEYHDVLRERVRKCNSAGGKTIDILNYLITRGREDVTSEEIGSNCNIDHTGGHFSNMIGPLSTLGLIDRNRGIVTPTEIMFPEVFA